MQRTAGAAEMLLWEAEARRHADLRMADLNIAHDAEISRLRDKVSGKVGGIRAFPF